MLSLLFLKIIFCFYFKILFAFHFYNKKSNGQLQATSGKKNQNISEQKVADVIGKQQCHILHSESD